MPAPDTAFLTDAELIRELHLPEKVGRRAIQELDKAVQGRRRFPKKDPLFGDRRFWPAVVEWFFDYYGVRLARESAEAVTIQPTWPENFNADPTPRKADRPEHARSRLAAS